MLYEHAPKKLAEKYPDARIMVMLRNPADRAYSQYIMNLRQGNTLEKDFLTEIQQDDRKPIKGWGANHQYLMIGFYYRQLKRYYDLFPAENIKIFLFEDYKADADKVVREMFEFLGVNPDVDVNTSEKANEGGIPKLKYINYFLNQYGIISWAKENLPRSWRSPFKKWMYKSGQEVPKMTREERQFLIDYYRSDIEQLQGLIHRDLQKWLTL